MNAKGIFGLTEEEEDDEETYAIKAQSLSTATVLNAISRLGADETSSNENVEIIQQFLRSVENYDGAEEEFVSCLERLDARAIAVTPYGKVMGKFENLAYRVAFNTARLDHPLIVKSKEPVVYNFSNPPSNTAFVSVVEQVPHR